MIRNLTAALLLTSGCSLLFDPSTLDAGGGAGGGTGGGGGGGAQCPATCASLPNTSAGCDAGACVYTCTGTFKDFDGDLTDGGTTGCETDCSSPVPATNPVGVIATVGSMPGSTGPGALELIWPESAPPTSGYVVCLDTQCFFVTTAMVCSQGFCGFLLPTGLPANNRMEAVVQGFNACSGAAPGTPPRVSFTPIAPLDPTKFDIESSPSGCAPTLSVPSVGELSVTQAGCFSKLKLGDPLWGSATAQVDVFVTSTASAPDNAGLAALTTPAGHLAGTGFAYKDADRPLILGYWTAGGWFPQYGATSVYTPQVNQWETIRFIISGDVSSVSTGLSGAPPVERLRWPSPEPDAGTLSGKPGLFVNGAGTVRFRNFVLSTYSGLPVAGPKAVNYSMVDAGVLLPSSWRVRPAPNTASARLTQCPPFPEASACTAGACAPGPRGCLRLERTSPLISPPEGSALFDLPTGIDVRKPWSYSFRFAATDGGSNNAVITSGVSNNGFLSPRDLLRGRGANWTQPLESGPQGLGVSLEPNHWNRVRFSFEGDAGMVSVELNGTPLVTYPRPAAWDAHPGALQLGDGPDLELFITDINVSQP